MAETGHDWEFRLEWRVQAWRNEKQGEHHKKCPEVGAYRSETWPLLRSQMVLNVCQTTCVMVNWFGRTFALTKACFPTDNSRGGA